jgi:hypothetical protein
MVWATGVGTLPPVTTRSLVWYAATTLIHKEQASFRKFVTLPVVDPFPSFFISVGKASSLLACEACFWSPSIWPVGPLARLGLWFASSIPSLSPTRFPLHYDIKELPCSLTASASFCPLLSNCPECTECQKVPVTLFLGHYICLILLSSAYFWSLPVLGFLI